MVSLAYKDKKCKGCGNIGHIGDIRGTPVCHRCGQDTTKELGAIHEMYRQDEEGRSRPLTSKEVRDNEVLRVSEMKRQVGPPPRGKKGRKTHGKVVL
jgi:hypothetical protein